MTIPILVGSLRPNGNHVGLSQMLLECCKTHGVDAALASDLLPAGPTIPTGPVLDDLIPAAVQDSSQYNDSNVQEWSKVISNSSAIIILSPQYNWGIPGNLKNSLDAIFHEWQGKPFLVITYGGHGGDKCGDALKLVIEGGLHAIMVTEPVNISIPKELIVGAKRVDPSDPDQKEFREQFEEALEAPLKLLKEKI
jgi:NAD(P)H-dependent FMN reductase